MDAPAQIPPEKTPRASGGLGDWYRDSALLVSTQALTAIATITLGILIARSLTPGNFGLFSGFLGVSQAAAILVDMGLAVFLLREFSRLDLNTNAERGSASSMLSGGLALVAIAGVILVVAATLVALAMSQDTEVQSTLIGLVAYTSILSAAFMFEMLARSQRQIHVVVIGAIVEKMLLLALVAIVLAKGYGIGAIAIAYVAAALVHLVIAFILTRRSCGIPLVGTRIAELWTLIKSAVPFALNRLALNLVPRLDTLIVAGFSVTAAGFFAAGDRLVGAVLFIPVAMSSALFPILSRSEDPSRAAKQVNVVLFASGLLICVPAELWAPQIVEAVFGAKYLPATDAIRIMLLAIPFIFLSNGLLAHLYTAGRERTVAATTMVAAIAGTIGVIAGAASNGVEGAAVAYSLRQIAFTAVLLWLAARVPRVACNEEDDLVGTLI